MRGGDAVDVILLAFGFGEIEIAADVVVLVVVGEELLGLGLAQAEAREGDGDAEASRERLVFGDQLLQSHDGCAARFSGHVLRLLSNSLLPNQSASGRISLKVTSCEEALQTTNAAWILPRWGAAGCAPT